MLMGGHDTPDMVDFLGQFGFDSILIEGEHGPVDFGHISDLSRGLRTVGLDFGGQGGPQPAGHHLSHIRSGSAGHHGAACGIEDARAVVDASKYGPIGHRGAAGSRQGYGVEDYVNKANDETLVAVLFEDIVAINNLEEIVTVDHIDVFYVAPGDLAQSMILTGQTPHPDVKAAVDRGIIKTIVDAGKVAGMLVNDSTVDDYQSKGVR